jgi:hypothetical protein
MVRKLPLVLVLFVCTVSLCAQNAPAGPNSPPSEGRQGGAILCLQRAGVAQSVIEQLVSVHRDMRTQVEGVCSDSSIPVDQKRQQVQAIRQQAEQKVEGLITPEQEKEVAACRQSAQRSNHPGGEGGLFAGVGCGGMRAGAGRSNNRQRGDGPASPSPVSQSAPQN